MEPTELPPGVARRTSSERARALRSASSPLLAADGPDERRLRVAVAVPAHDEEAAIERVLRSVPRDSTDVRYRSFVCDDGSTDGTAAVARNAGATVVRHSQNLGIGASLTTALEAARRWKPDIIVHIASDGQDDPTLIPQLLDPILRGEADYVIASRFLTGAVGMGPVRRVGIRFYSLLIRFLVGLRITDVTSGFRAFRADTYDSLSVRSDTNWAIEMALRAGLNRIRTVEVPAPYLPRVGGRSQFDYRRMFFIYHFRVVLQMFRGYTAPRRPLGAVARAGPMLVPSDASTAERRAVPRLTSPVVALSVGIPNSAPSVPAYRPSVSPGPDSLKLNP